MTLLLPSPCTRRMQPQLGFVAGVALARAVRSILPAGIKAGLKWPNDLQIRGAKVSGLLLEGLADGAAVALGIGLNLVAHPPDTPYPATNLAAEGVNLSVPAAFEAISRALVDELDAFGDGSGFPLTRARWLAACAHAGQIITVSTEAGRVSGLFSGIDPEGRLLLESDTGLVGLAAGDVFPLDK